MVMIQERIKHILSPELAEEFDIYFPINHAYKVFPDLRHEAQLTHITRKSIGAQGTGVNRNL
jgi:hypothetical protein